MSDEDHIAELFAGKMMPRASKRILGPAGRRVDCELRRMFGEGPVAERPPQIITQADIDAEVERKKEAKL